MIDYPAPGGKGETPESIPVDPPEGPRGTLGPVAGAVMETRGKRA